MPRFLSLFESIDSIFLLLFFNYLFSFGVWSKGIDLSQVIVYG